MSKIIITGATGNAGSAVLSAAIASLNIAHITVLARRPPYEISPKVESEPRLVVERLKGHGPCIWAVGISQTQVKQKEYCRINHDCTLEAAKGFSALGNGSDPFRFVFMSAEGARKGEKGWSAYSRVKGKTERELAAMAFKTFAPVSVRPAGTNPTQEHSTRMYWLWGPGLRTRHSRWCTRRWSLTRRIWEKCVSVSLEALEEGKMN
ncbi:hypothetical protein IAR50_003365 [Cryptococcus sp. DSM 104548]